MLALVIDDVAEIGGRGALSRDERLEHGAASLHRIEERAAALRGRLVVHVVVVHGHEANRAHRVALRPERICSTKTETHVALVRRGHRARDEQHILARRSRRARLELERGLHAVKAAASAARGLAERPAGGLREVCARRSPGKRARRVQQSMQSLRAAATAGVIGVTGDLLMQWKEGRRSVDWARAGRLAAFRTVHAPVIDYSWRFFDRAIPFTGAVGVAARVVADQGLLMPPSLVAFFLSQSAMEGLSAEACVARTKDAFIPTGAPA